MKKETMTILNRNKTLSNCKLILWAWFFVFIFVILPAVYVGAYNKLIIHEDEVIGTWMKMDEALQARHYITESVINTLYALINDEQESKPERDDAMMVLSELTQDIDAETNKSNHFLQAVEVKVLLENPKVVHHLYESKNNIGQAMNQIFEYTQDIPELKSHQKIGQLKTEFNDSEIKLTQKQSQYNDAVKQLNQSLSEAPGKWLIMYENINKKAYYE